MNYKIDNLQYCKWSREVFQINRDAGLDAVHVTVVYHEDYDEFLKKVNEWNTHFKENSDHKIVDISNIPPEMMALDIGPKSIENIKSIFKNIKTLLWNGPLGAFEINPFGMGTFSLAKIAADLTVKDELITVAGGGDTASALNKAGVAEDFTYISSAGGAFLEWLEGIELPAISVLGKN